MFNWALGNREEAADIVWSNSKWLCSKRCSAGSQVNCFAFVGSTLQPPAKFVSVERMHHYSVVRI